MQSGGNYTTNEILEFLNETEVDISLRTIQRDLKILDKLNIIYIYETQGKEQVWRIQKEVINTRKTRKLKAEELLSFYILKSYLKSFKSTMIEDEIEALTRTIEEIAPEEVFKNIFWDQTFGAFDYKQYDAMIRRSIHFISKEKWVDLTYDTAGEGKIKKIVAFPCSLFNYNGSLYLVAYEYKHKSYIALAIQYIDTMEEKTDFYVNKPKFDYKEFAKSRFAVYSGLAYDVKIKINKDMAKFFINRTWHQTQTLKKQSNGDYILTMKVPLGEDLVAWILSWSPSIEVLEPQLLIDKLSSRIRESMKLYS